MGANPRTKGQSGEREIADALNYVVFSEMKKQGDPKPIINSIQRNQQQSAVGGADLTNTFDLAIEVKRQEALAINTWWAQCVKSAERNGHIPVLVYRQNRGKWKVVMNCELLVSQHGTQVRHLQVRAEISWEDFLAYFADRVAIALQIGHKVTI